MAFADLSLNIDVELSPEEVSSIDKALSLYREVKGSDPIIDDLSIQFKDLIKRANEANEYLRGLEDEEEPVLLVESSEDNRDGETGDENKD